METYYSDIQSAMLDNLDARRNRRVCHRRPNTDVRSKNKKNRRKQIVENTERHTRSHKSLVRAVEEIYQEREFLRLQYEDMMDEYIERQEQYRNNQDEDVSDDETQIVSRPVRFDEMGSSVFTTYSPEEYDRSSVVSWIVRGEMNRYKSNEMVEDPQQNIGYYNCPYCNKCIIKTKTRII